MFFCVPSCNDFWAVCDPKRPPQDMTLKTLLEASGEKHWRLAPWSMGHGVLQFGILAPDFPHLLRLGAMDTCRLVFIGMEGGQHGAEASLALVARRS